MTKNLLKAFRSVSNPRLRLFNVYGPAEVSFTSNTREVSYVSRYDPSELSMPTWPNYSVYIVNSDLRPLPVGVSGEICIGGGGVGLGYFKDETRTSEAFIEDKLAPAEFTAIGWKTMHRTGDRGRLLPDGGLVVEGRVIGDTQVKIRGIRMNLQDIEDAIVQVAGDKITDAAASVRQDDESDSQYLVAHVVLIDDPLTQGGNEAGFLTRVIARLPLPQHMKPSILVPFTKLPLNSSNKLDRRAVQTLPIARTNSREPQQAAAIMPLQAKIRDLWREAIPTEIINSYSIGPETDFFHVGGTSLLLVHLQGLLNEEYGKAPALHKMFEYSTLAGMASLFSEDSSDQGRAASSIDWDQESSLLPSPSAIPQTTSSTPLASPPRTVILTGATGFLGQHLLRALLRDQNIRRVHCIAVRGRTGPLPALLTSNPRVTVRKGDLGSELLGLSEETAAVLFAEADVIIHNGADVSFLKTYTTLRRTNVASTRVLAALAAARQVPVHYISSASVAQLALPAGLDEFGEVSAAAYPPAEDARDLATSGYTAAKWASERVLEKAAEAWGLPVTIHRPSSIVGDGAGDLDLMRNLFCFVEEMKAVPESQAWRGYFNFVSVENVAADVVAAVMQSRDSGEQHKGNPVRYLFEAGEIVYPLAMMRELQSGDKDAGQLPVRTLPLSEWVEEAKKRGLDSMLAEYLVTADGNGSPLAFPKLVKSKGVGGA